MKSLIRTSLLVFGSFLCLAFLAVEGKAQCQDCGVDFCVGTATGFQGCIMTAQSCTLFGICPIPIIDRNGNPRNSCQVKPLPVSHVNIPDSMITEIGALDPDMAMALISIRNIRAEFVEGKIRLFPLEFTASDVQNSLGPLGDGSNIDSIRVRRKNAAAQSLPPVIYRFSIQSDKAGNISTLKVVPEDSAVRRSVNISLDTFLKGKSENVFTIFEAVSWQYKP